MTTKDNKDVKPTIKADILDMASVIKKEITVDKSGVAVASPDLYEKLLPEGLTKKVINDVNHHNNAFAAATTLALGELAIGVMKKHKDLDRATLSVPTVGKDSFEFSFDRSKVVTKPGGGEDSKTTKFGTSNVSFTMYGTKSRGDLLKVKSHLSDEALKAFGGQ